MMEHVPCLPKVCFAAFLTLGITGGGVMDPVVVMAQDPERRPVPELVKSFFEKTASQPYTYKVGSRRDPFVPLQFSGSPDDSDATEQLDSGNAEGERPIILVTNFTVLATLLAATHTFHGAEHPQRTKHRFHGTDERQIELGKHLYGRGVGLLQV